MVSGSSALRLCVWLFDNFRIELFYIYQGFLFALGAIEREVFQHCIRAQLDPGFLFAGRTEQPFHFAHTHAIQSAAHWPIISRASLCSMFPNLTWSLQKDSTAASNSLCAS